MNTVQVKQTPYKKSQRRSDGWRDRYGLDVRSLALFRIGLALVILAVLWADVWTGFASSAGSTGAASQTALQAGAPAAGYWSLHALSGSPLLQAILWLVSVFAAITMLFGYHTRIAVIASWVLLISLHNRSPLAASAVASVVDGALVDNVLRVMMFWAMFLPLGAAYSVDRAMNTATRPVPLRVFSGATIALMVQQSFIYIFSTLTQPATTTAAWVTSMVVWFGLLLLWSPIRHTLCRTTAVVAFVLLVGFGVALNPGTVPLSGSLLGLFLGVVTWLAFLPGAFWEQMSQRVYGPVGEGPKRTGLRIYYDADCGFCKKVVHLIRMLLVLPHTPLATAQSIAEIHEAMERQNSWVIVDWQQKHHYKFEGIAYVVSLSPVFGGFSHVLRWRPVMAIGTKIYEWIANNRRTAGRFTRPFKFKPLTVKTPGWLSAIALFLTCLTLVWNLRSLTTHQSYVDGQQPAISSAIAQVTSNPTVRRLDWLAHVTRLDQSWGSAEPGAEGFPVSP